MEYGFSILMFCFSAALLLYAAMLALEKRRPDLLIPRRVYVSKKNWTTAYARMLAKIVAVVALAPLLAGCVGLFADPLWTGITFVAAMTGAIWLGMRLTREERKKWE